MKHCLSFQIGWALSSFKATWGGWHSLQLGRLVILWKWETSDAKPEVWS